MLQFVAALFFLIALVAPLALIAVTLQQSGRAILSALQGDWSGERPAAKVTRLRIRPVSAEAPSPARPLRAAA